MSSFFAQPAVKLKGFPRFIAALKSSRLSSSKHFPRPSHDNQKSRLLKSQGVNLICLLATNFKLNHLFCLLFPGVFSAKDEQSSLFNRPQHLLESFTDWTSRTLIYYDRSTGPSFTFTSDCLPESRTNITTRNPSFDYVPFHKVCRQEAPHWLTFTW